MGDGLAQSVGAGQVAEDIAGNYEHIDGFGAAVVGNALDAAAQVGSAIYAPEAVAKVPIRGVKDFHLFTFCKTAGRLSMLAGEMNATQRRLRTVKDGVESPRKVNQGYFLIGIMSFTRYFGAMSRDSLSITSPSTRTSWPEVNPRSSRLASRVTLPP